MSQRFDVRRPATRLRAGLLPALVAVVVLGLVVGAVVALRAGSGGSTTGGAGDAAGGAGSGDGVLHLDDYQPVGENPVDPQYRLAGDLPADGPQQAAVRRLGTPDGAAVQRLAAALGLPTDVRVVAGGVRVVTDQGRRLTVQRDGRWQYLATGVDSPVVPCPPHPTAPSDTDKGLSIYQDCPVSSAVATHAEDPVDPPAPGLATDPRRAREVAAPVLRAVGAEADQARVGRAGPAVTVVGDPSVTGLPTSGMQTSVTVVATRVVTAAGWLASTSRGADYPLVGAQQAWETLRRTPIARPLMACPQPLPPATDPLTCGGPIVVTGASFGLSVHQQGDEFLLVPSWLFAVRNAGSDIAVVAVAPDHLAAEPGAGAGSGGVAPGATGSAVPPQTGTGAPGAGGTGATSSPESRFTAVRVSADGGALNVGFYGGAAACYSYRVVADEGTPGMVRLTLVETVSSNARCDEIAQLYQRRVALADPLGNRSVVDAATGAVLVPASR